MKNLKDIFFIVFISIAVLSCSSTDPKKMKVPMGDKVTAPEVKVTKYTDPLKDFGLMLEIYLTKPTKIILKEVTDKTNASQSTGGEIQQNITEISKSTLNSMGENVIYIEYDPEFIANMQQTGYSDFGNKLIPDVIVTGAITEFDRSLSQWQSVSFLDDSAGQSKSRITLDFNMRDFKTLTSIPSMTTVTSMEVQRGQAGKETAISLLGITYGANGSMRKTQGRHDAIRQLVQSSMLQLVGKYAAVPYWRVLGSDAVPDEYVLRNLKREFERLSPNEQISRTQRYLNLHGYDVDITGTLDSKTKTAFDDFRSKNNVLDSQLDPNTYLRIYLTVPINEATYERSQALNAGQNLGTNKNNQVAGETLFEISKVGNMLTAAYGHFKQGDFQTSIQMFTDSLNVTPTPVAYYFIALCYQSMKDVNKAIVSLETGTRAFNDFELWKALGLAYSELGDKEKARKAFTAANAINPNDRQIKFFLEEK